MSVQQDEMFNTRVPDHQRSHRGGREMADSESASGTFGRRAQAVLAALKEAGPLGMTSPEMRAHLGGEATGNHHGKVSGALSTLHAEGAIAALAAKRSKANIYVLPEHVQGRPTKRYGGKTVEEREREVNDAVAEGVLKAVGATTQRLEAAALTEDEIKLFVKVHEALTKRVANNNHNPDGVTLPLFANTLVTMIEAARRMDTALRGDQ